MVMIGADVSELRATGEAFAKAAEQISGQIEPALTKLVSATTWVGVDAAAFKGAWVLGYATRLKLVAASLSAASGKLMKNADAQEQTSGQGGAFLSGGAALGGRVESASADNSKLHKPSRSALTGIRGFRRDLMDLAAASYDHSTGASHEDLIPNGWEEVSREEMAKLGIDRDKLGVYGEDFSATLFRNAEGKYVLAFKGSDNAGDWISNGVGGLAKLATPQDLRAAEVALHVQAMLRGSGIDRSQLIMTGHSLGGRLATVASIATGTEAVTFNSAGTSDLALLMANKLRKDVLGESGTGRSAAHVHNIVDCRDALHKARGIQVDAQLAGSVELIGENQGSWASNPVKKHMLDSLATTYDNETWEARGSISSHR